jgi:hypothetical protein
MMETDYKEIQRWHEAYSDKLHEHIKYVQEAGRRLGVDPLQLAVHDRSKWTEAEFHHYARQFHGDAGNPNGFAGAWLHHLHKNNHHWQHYIFPDGFSLKGSDLEAGVMPMPEKYALEMIADWMGSSYVYTGSWDMALWLDKNTQKILLHSRTAEYVKKILEDLGYEKMMFKLEADRYHRIQQGY